MAKTKKTQPKRLTRDSNNQILGGVASGMANYFNLDPVLMRVIFILVLIFTGFFPGIIAYFIMWIIMPEK
ncbi:MAG: PspC domain-containing protein [Nanoarchaeota archaeon]